MNTVIFEKRPLLGCLLQKPKSISFFGIFFQTKWFQRGYGVKSPKVFRVKAAIITIRTRSPWAAYLLFLEAAIAGLSGSIWVHELGVKGE